MTRARARYARTILYGKLLFLCRIPGFMTLLSEPLREVPSVEARCHGGVVDKSRVGKSHMQKNLGITRASRLTETTHEEA